MKVYDGSIMSNILLLIIGSISGFIGSSNENVLLYTLPGGSVSAAVGSKEYTDITEKE